MKDSFEISYFDSINIPPSIPHWLFLLYRNRRQTSTLVSLSQTLFLGQIYLHLSMYCFYEKALEYGESTIYGINI